MGKIIITGASGFIGSALSLYSIKMGHQVIPCSRKKISGNFHLGSYFNTPNGDHLIHLAEEPNRNKVNNLGREYQLKSLELTQHLSKKYGRKMIYASSSIVYGDKNLDANPENRTLVKTDLYSETKITNESIVLKNGGNVIRLSNIFGQHMNKNNVISDVMAQITDSKPIKIQNGSPIRDFLYIDDLIRGIYTFIEHPINGIFNLGSGRGISIYDLTIMLLSLYNQSQRQLISSINKSDPSKILLDIEKIHKATGWKPSKSLEARLLELITNNKELHG